MSSVRQAVILVLSLTSAGKRPSLTPVHHVDLDTGNTTSTCCKRINPVNGDCCVEGDCVIVCFLFLLNTMSLYGAQDRHALQLHEQDMQVQESGFACGLKDTFAFGELVRKIALRESRRFSEQAMNSVDYGLLAFKY